MKKIIQIFVCSMVFFSCSNEAFELSPIEELPLNYQSDFSVDSDGWIGNFADLPVDDSIIYELEFAHTKLPSPLDTNKNALMIKGSNRSDDLFMYITKKLEGFEPNREYSLILSIKMASNSPWGLIGIGGAPAESVYLKAGVISYKPERDISFDAGFSQGYYVMNIDKGNQSQEGVDMKVLGDIGYEGDSEFTLIERHYNGTELTATSNEKGELWVIIGTDSGYEGITELYYSDIQLFFVEQP